MFLFNNSEEAKIARTRDLYRKYRIIYYNFIKLYDLWERERDIGFEGS